MGALAAALAFSALVAAPGVALAADPQSEVVLVIEANRFQPEEVRVKDRAPFLLVVTNLEHGTEEFESRELRIEKVIPSGNTVRLRMPALKAGTFPIVGAYHAKTENVPLLAAQPI